MQHKTPNEYLDQRAQDLAEKHQQRLQAMTFQTMAPPRQPRKVAWIKPTLASVFSLAIIATAVFWHNAEKPTTVVTTVLPALPALSVLPTWVMDTKTPDTLIENLDFYDWLAQQTEHQQNAAKKHPTLVINQYAGTRISQQFTTYNLTQRLPRTAFYFRNF